MRQTIRDAAGDRPRNVVCDFELVSREKRKYLNGRKVHDIRYKHERKDECCRWISMIKLCLKEEIENGERANLRWSRSGEHTKTKLTIIFTSNIPSYFEETGAVGEGSAKRIQYVAVTTPGLDVGRSDMSDLVVLRQGKHLDCLRDGCDLLTTRVEMERTGGEYGMRGGGGHMEVMWLTLGLSTLGQADPRG